MELHNKKIRKEHFQKLNDAMTILTKTLLTTTLLITLISATLHICFYILLYVKSIISNATCT